MSTSIPSTQDYLEFHALRSPDAVALIHDGREYTFDQFYRNLQKFTNVMRNFTMSPGSIVSICCADLYVHLLLIMACENNRLVTASFLASEGNACRPLLSMSALVIADDNRFAADSARFHHLTPQWLNGVFFLDDYRDDLDPIPPGGIDDPIRLIRSSGTTGSQKLMFKTRGMLEGEINRSAIFFGAPLSPFRSLVTLPLTVAGTYRRYMLNIRMGLTSVYDTTMSPFDAMVKYDVRYFSTVPMMLEKLLNEIPPNFVKPDGMVVVIFGASVSDKLRQRVLSRLATNIIEVYASNEADVVALVDETGVGTLAPGAAAEVVDEDDNRLPLGEIGRVRVKVPGLVDGYLDDPEATAALFRDGWFYPGDVGVMPAPRRLQILGRDDDQLNIGGVKIEPSTIEDILLGISALRPSVQDLAVTSIENVNGIEEICVAVVANEGAEDKSIAEQIKRTLPAEYGNVRVKLVNRIPRTASRKVQRYLLKSEFRS